MEDTSLEVKCVKCGEPAIGVVMHYGMVHGDPDWPAGAELGALCGGCQASLREWMLRRVGVRGGRPVAVPRVVERRIRSMRQAGAGYAKIAQELNTTRTPTVGGGEKWHPSTVARVCSRLGLSARIEPTTPSEAEAAPSTSD